VASLGKILLTPMYMRTGNYQYMMKNMVICAYLDSGQIKTKIDWEAI